MKDSLVSSSSLYLNHCTKGECQTSRKLTRNTDIEGRKNTHIEGTYGYKVAQLVRCWTSNQRVAVSIPGRGTLVFLGQDSLFHIASVYPAAKWVPSINKAVLRACALYAASCSGISPGGLKWFPCVQCLLGKEGRVSASVDTRL